MTWQDLVPRPRVLSTEPGSFMLTETLAIQASPHWAAIARRLLSPGTGLELPRSSEGELCIQQDSTVAAEGYHLRVSAAGIEITAADDRGVNWAVQTLRQLLPSSVLRAAPIGENLDLEIPAVSISDAPRFSWRGVMLDVGRHFAPLHDLFGFIDLLALHKYNVLHLHLSEDQGWRMESLSHPRLHEVGSTRHQTRRLGATEGDGTPHGGYYTQEQLRSLVRYADQRGVDIVPELDFPGHVRAVLAAYPHLGNHPEKEHAPADTFGIFEEVLNLSDETMDVVVDLYTELLDIFPSSHIHIGGDECPRTEWIASQAAQELARRRGLPDATHLQHWFTRQLRDLLAARGRRAVGWDEINDDGHLSGAVTMAWRDRRYGVEAAAAGGEVVMAPCSHLYFDYYPSDDPGEPYSIGGHTPLEQVYGFDPVDGVDAGDADRIIGTQCQLWTEYMPTMRRVQYMMFPRACAHAEVAWSDPTDRSFEEFEPRLEAHLHRLEALGVEYRPLPGPRPWQRGGTGHWARA